MDKNLDNVFKERPLILSTGAQHPMVLQPRRGHRVQGIKACPWGVTVNAFLVAPLKWIRIQSWIVYMLSFSSLKLVCLYLKMKFARLSAWNSKLDWIHRTHQTLLGTLFYLEGQSKKILTVLLGIFFNNAVFIFAGILVCQQFLIFVAKVLKE